MAVDLGSFIRAKLDKFRNDVADNVTRSIVGVGQGPVGQFTNRIEQHINSPTPTKILPEAKLNLQVNMNKPLAPQYLHNLGQVPGIVYNLAATIPNTIVGQGIIDPAIDISRQLRGVTGNGPTPQYGQLKSPQVRLGYQLGDALFTGGQGMEGTQHRPTEYIGNVAGSLMPIASAYGGGKVFGIGKAAGTPLGAQTLNRAIWEGMKTGGKAGFVFGGLSGLEQNRLPDAKMKKIYAEEDKEDRKAGRKPSDHEASQLLHQLYAGGSQAIIGLGTGAILGGVASGAGYGINKLKQRGHTEEVAQKMSQSGSKKYNDPEFLKKWKDANSGSHANMTTPPQAREIERISRDPSIPRDEKVSRIQNEIMKMPDGEYKKSMFQLFDNLWYGQEASTRSTGKMGYQQKVLKALGAPDDINPQGGFVRIARSSKDKISKRANQSGSQPILANQDFSDDVQRSLKGGQIRERGFVTSVKESAKTPSGVKRLVAGEYVVRSNKQLAKDAMKLIRSNPAEAEAIAVNPQSATDVEVGNILIHHYASKGQFAKAARVANGMANSGTEMGQAIQAFSQYDKTTPEGAVRFAQQNINSYNRLHPEKKLRLDDAMVKSIFDQAHKIQEMPEGRARNVAANKLMNEVNDLIPSSFGDKLTTVWKAGLLTSLRTHERNLLGNSLMTTGEVAKDIPASVADRAMALKTGKRTTSFTMRGMGEGTKTGLQRAKDQITLGYDPSRDISKYDVRHVTWGKNGFEQAMKKYTDVVFNTLAAEDKPFWNAAYARSLYDQAGAQAVNAGKQGNTAYIKNLVANPSDDMVKLAATDANYATFHDANAMTKVATGMKQALSKNEVTKIGSEMLAPFTGVPTSIAEKMFSYSPGGLIRGGVDFTKVVSGNMPQFQRQAAQEIGRGVIGTGILALGAFLADKGLVSGNAKDAAEARQWELEGKMANSIKLFGKWRSINSVGPQTLVFLAGAKANEASKKSEGLAATIGNTVAQALKDFTQQTFLAGVQQPLQVISDPNRYKPERYLGSQTASFIPNIIKDSARAVDPYVRESNTFMDQITNSIPFVRNKNITKRDALGNVISQEPTGAMAFVDLFNSRSPISNAVVDELSRLNQEGFNATPGKPNKNQTIQGEKMKLTPEQLNLFESQVGDLARESLALLFATDTYQNLSDEDKSKAVDATMTLIRKQVRGNISLENDTPNTTTQKDTSTGTAKDKGIIGDVAAAEKTAGVTTNKSTLNGRGIYTIVSPTGSVKQVDINTRPQAPNFTGDGVYDAQLRASYNSKLNSQINDIITLAETGKISKDEAIKLVNELTDLKSLKGRSVKFPKARKITLPKFPKARAIRVPKVKLKKIKQVKFKALKVKKPKIKLK